MISCKQVWRRTDFNPIFAYYILQNLKNQIMTTNLWVEQVIYIRVTCFEYTRWHKLYLQWSSYTDARSRGSTTNCAGSRRSTAASKCCTYRLITSGDRTSCFTTSMYWTKRIFVQLDSRWWRFWDCENYAFNYYTYSHERAWSKVWIYDSVIAIANHSPTISSTPPQTVSQY